MKLVKLKIIKKIFTLVTIIIVLLLTFTGCSNNKVVLWRTEINKIEYIEGVGVDKSLIHEGYMRLTISAQEKKGSGDNGQSMQKKSQPVYSEGRTGHEAVRKFFNFLEKRPFFGQIDHIIISEEIAKEGFLPYIDWFCRDPEVPLNTKFYIVKGCRAEDLMTKGSSREEFLANRIKDISNTQGGQSIWNTVDLIELMYIEDLPYKSLYAPYIELVSLSVESNDSNKPDDKLIELKMGGLAFFRGDKLAGYLDEKQSRGLNWIRREIGSGIIVLKSPGGSNVSLEIIDNKVKILPKIENGELAIDIKISVSSNVGEIHGTEDIFNDEIIGFLAKKQEDIISEEVNGIVEYAQEQQLDFIGMAGNVFRKFPGAWQDKYQDNWNKIFSKIKINVSVQSKINRTYNIKEPTRGGPKKTK